MATIARNHKKKIQHLVENVRYARVYNDHAWSEGERRDVSYLIDKWQRSNGARLTVEEDKHGTHWAFHFHSNHFVELYSYDYAAAKEADRPKPMPAPVAAAAPEPEAACFCGITPCPMPAQHANAQAACGAMNANQALRPATPRRDVDSALTLRLPRVAAEILTDAKSATAATGHLGPSAYAASAAVYERHIERGIVRRSPEMATANAAAAEVTAAAVAELRRLGVDDDGIRARFEAKRAEAVRQGRGIRAAVAESMLAAFAGMMADEARERAAASSPVAAAPERLALEAAKPSPVTVVMERVAQRAAGGHTAAEDAPVSAVREHQEQGEAKEAAPVGDGGGSWRVPAWWEKSEGARTVDTPADTAAAVELPPREEGYVPVKGGDPYEVRQARAALEAAGISVKEEGQEFPLFVSGRPGGCVNVMVHHWRGNGAKPPKGAAQDRWQVRRAEIMIALVNAGMTDVVLTSHGIEMRVPKPKGTGTVVQLGAKEYGDLYIEQPVSFPQYPEITGWTMRRRWGAGYIGPMTPWMYYAETGENLAVKAEDEHQAARVLAAHYGLVTPVRVWQ